MSNNNAARTIAGNKCVLAPGQMGIFTINLGKVVLLAPLPSRLFLRPTATSTPTVSSSPFRKEVLEHAAERRHGQVILTGQLSYWRITVLLVGVLVGAIAFLCFFTYARKAEVTGLLVPTQGLARVISVQSGVVTAMSAAEGKTVAAGDELFVLVSERPNAAGQDASVTVAKLLGVQRDSLVDDSERIAEQARAKAQSFRARVEALQLESASVEEHTKLQTTRVDIAAQELAQYVELEKSQFVSPAQRRAKEAELLSQRQRLADLGRSKANIAREISQLKSEALDTEVQAKRDQDAVRRSTASLDQDITENEIRREVRVKAPVAGILTSITVVPGQSVSAAQPLATILPHGNALEAELYAPSSAAGLVSNGMQVQLRYRAYPYQRYGQAAGTVKEISRTPLGPDELSPQAAAALKNSTEPLFYRMRVALERQTIDDGNLRALLKPGDRVDASIKLESRSLIAWIFEPVMSIYHKR